MNNYKWCEPSTQINDIRIGLDQIIVASYVQTLTADAEGCLRWVCHCKHDRGSHDYSGECNRCVCEKFTYLNNNNCDLECFYRAESV